MTLKELHRTLASVKAKHRLAKGDERERLGGLIVNVKAKIVNHPDYMRLREQVGKKKMKEVLKIIDNKNDGIKLSDSNSKLRSWASRIKAIII